MDVGALIIGLASGGTLGAVVTALLQHSHERDERHRERTLMAATGFLAAYDRATREVVEVQGRARVARSAGTASKERTGRFLEMSKDLVEAARDLPERERKGGGDGPDDGPLGRAIRALYELYEVTKAQAVGAQDLVAVGDAVSQIEASLPRLVDMPPPYRGFGKHLREVLSDIRLALKTDEALEAEMGALEEATNALRAQRPMIRVLFASDGGDVVRAAVKVVDDVMAATRIALLDAMGPRDGFDNAEAKGLLTSAGDSANEFADAVSRRVRPSRRWHLRATQ